MTRRKKFSHTVGKRQREKEADKEKWFLSYEWMLLFFAAAFSGIVVTTFQTVDPSVVDIAVYQIIIGVVGLMMGVVMNIKKGVVTPGLRWGFHTRDDVEKLFVYVTGGFIGLELFNTISGGLFNPYSSYSMGVQFNMALTAAVMEEALFSFAMTTFFFAVFLYMAVKVLNRYNEDVKTGAMVSAAIMVAIFFVLMHAAVYGFQPEIVLQLFVNRFVYAIIYIKTKNLVCPTILHILHNAMFFMPF